MCIYVHLPVDCGRGGFAQCVLFENDVCKVAGHVKARITIAVRKDERVVKTQHVVSSVAE